MIYLFNIIILINMKNINGYIYIRTHISYDVHNACKLGKTINIPERDDTYKTGEIIKGKFFNVYQIDIKKLNIIDNLLKYKFQKLNIKFDGGTEFYEKIIINKIEPYFNKLKLEFKKLSQDEIISLIRKYRVKKIFNKINKINLIKYLKSNINKNKTFNFKLYQQEAIDNILNHNSRLQHLVISPTGTGKTLIFAFNICKSIINNKKNIIILTKKKEILSQMKVRLNQYIKLFVDNNLIPSFDYNIIECLNNCCNDKLNKTRSKPTIFIINWDKFTSANDTDHKLINWKYFDLLILDESHWNGANGIYNVMKYIKDNTNVNYLGFSATPVRLNYSCQTNILDIFGDKKDYNVIFEYTYFEAIKNKHICPIRYSMIDITTDDLVFDEDEDDDDIENSDKKQTKILSTKSYKKVWTQIKTNIIDKTHFKKGIFYFRSRKDLLTFYNKMKNKVGNFKLIPTMSISSNDNDKINELIVLSGLTNNDFDNGINTFLKTDDNVILLSVFRATEGFDDQKLEFAVRMYFSLSVNYLMETQRMGRIIRLYENNPDSVKKYGYYATLEINNDVELIKKSLIKRFRSWIQFAKKYNKHKDKNDINNKKRDIKETISMYFDINQLKFYNIDLEKDILDKLNFKEFDKHKIKHALKIHNQNLKEEEQIKTKSKYDEWAFENDFPTIDELEDLGFNDLKWLFNIKEDDYLSWKEFKKIFKIYKDKNPDICYVKLYDIILKEHNVPIEPEEFYKNKFTSFNDI
jgi:superfamily II DNA or RNA helicase